MTNKQVIYNGVDVSMCEFLTKTGHCKAQMSIMGIDANKCKCFPNCYYKQLKAKEQECESWKKANDEKNELLAKLGCHTTATARRKEFTLQQQLDQLKVENEELKKSNKHIEHNRNQKADKLMRIEKLITACSTGYTDEFIQELLVILHEPEPNSFEINIKQLLP